MKKSALSYYVFIRGIFQFGLIAGGLFLGFSLLTSWPNFALTLNHALIALFAPVFGAGLGLIMYWIDKRRGKLSDS